jgi:hypothetical protein
VAAEDGDVIVAVDERDDDDGDEDRKQEVIRKKKLFARMPYAQHHRNDMRARITSGLSYDLTASVLYH